MTYQLYSPREYRLLHALDGVEVPKEAADILASIRELVAYETARRERESAEARDREARIAAILDSDVAVTEGRCEAVPSTGWRRKCGTPAKVRRTYQTRQVTGYRLDGKPVGDDGCVEGAWEVGKGFVRRRLTEADWERVERVVEDVTHNVLLCGRHRKRKGYDGFPY